MRHVIAQFGPAEDLNMDHYPRDMRTESVFDGMFYQPGDEAEVGRRQASVTPYITGPEHPSLMQLDDYQDWAELNWKVPHGTYKAVRRFSDKGMEEAFESATELRPRRPYTYFWPGDSDATLPVDAAKDELGDVLWSATAASSNSGISLDEATRTVLHDHDIVRKRGVPLRWVDIDYIISSGFNPTYGPLDRLYPDDFEEYDPMLELGVSLSGLRVNIERQYAHGEDRYFVSHFRSVGEEIKPIVGHIVLLTGYYANKWAGTTLGEVAAYNIEKINQRAATNTVR